MAAADPSAILARISLWAAELRERGQVDDAAATRLNETLAESLGERLDRQDDPLLVVMLCGPTAVGKSSLINALAGGDISRPGLGATTCAAVLYVHEEDDPARLFEYSHLLASSEQPDTALVRHRRDELLHKVLVDTPDIDSFMSRHKELTARLVHAADLVLFVTSPEKYKVMGSGRWILEQRQRRAMAFLLNKWDREALGLQRDRRGEVEEDFRNVLTGEGFPDALVFKVSALTTSLEGPGTDHIENELPALRAWLETGISQSMTITIRQRRLRAAWGRLSAAIEPAVPRPLSGHPLLMGIIEGLASGGKAAERSVSTEASVLDPVGFEDGGCPVTPGLLGMWTRARHSISLTTASLRSGISMLNLAGYARNAGGPSQHQPMSGDAFGGRSVAAFSETAQRLVGEASAARLALDPVGAAWTAEAQQLERRLTRLPLDVIAELMAETNRPTVRRLAGIASVYAVEGLIVLVLLIAVGRVGIDFVAGSYAPKGLFASVLELNLILVVIGNIVATMFFPPLRQRARRNIANRARSLVTDAVERAQSALREHVEAVDGLAREGRELLLMIDHIVLALTAERGGEANVDRLFGRQERQIRLNDGVTERPPPLESDREDPTRRRPSFD
jgi:energy-coupling factor transporter ATP-binding protein EcfA2